jgi:hypothetical protein
MTDPLAPYANETPEQKAERERQQAAQAELESGALNVPPQVPPEPPPPEGGETARGDKARK